MSTSDNEGKSATPSIYQQFLAERNEIHRHKWLRSEESGADIGFESALLDWAINERSSWRKERLKKNRQT